MSYIGIIQGYWKRKWKLLYYNRVQKRKKGKDNGNCLGQVFFATPFSNCMESPHRQGLGFRI